MRTKNLMLAMSALAIAGCSQNEITEISPDANPAVGFEVYTGVQTRGTETNTTSIQASADAGFGVLAYKTSSSGWATDGSAATPGFMYNEHVYKGASTDSKWKYDNLRFWPTNTDKLTFFAYAPYESAPSAGTDKGIKLSGQSEQGAPTIEFTVNTTKLTEMVDLVTDHDKKDKTSADGSISFSFSHVLTRVLLKAKTNVNLGSDTRVYIKEIKISQTNQLYSKATYKFADDTWAALSTPAYIADNQALSGNEGVLNLVTPTSNPAWGYTTSSILVNGDGTTATDLFKSGHALYLIPVGGTTGLSAKGDVKLKVSYDIVTKVNDTTNVTSSVSDKAIDLPKDALAKGKSYTYTIIIGMNAVELSGTVSNWTDATPSGSDLQ